MINKTELYKIAGQLGGIKSLYKRGLITEKVFKKKWSNLIKIKNEKSK